MLDTYTYRGSPFTVLSITYYSNDISQQDSAILRVYGEIQL